MQASGAYAPSPYQNPYHIVIPGPQDHELKKQYLALLPPQQIIDICLNFDLHVPPYVKSSVWPADINAAIRAIQKASPNAHEPPSQLSSSTDVHRQTDNSQPESTNPSGTTSVSIEKPSEAHPPDKPSPTPDPATSAQTSTQPSPAPQGQANSEASTSLNPSAPQPPYPHQPYGYGPTAAYPHAPYYQAAPGYPPYPSPYPYGAYPPGYPQQPNVPYGTQPPLTHPQPPTQDGFNPAGPPSTDDLPSYEEMIVEALNDSTDPEGCAPKDLFTWMASRYPLQSNFRPSASQALQKAFKRGRFEKSSSGKYRLNASWEGGNTSRRATRRPQTQNAAAAPQAPAPPPFTHAPLAHHQQPQSGYQPSAYGYFYPGQPGYPGYSQVPPSQTTKAQLSSQPPAASQSASTARGPSTATDAPPLQAEGTAQDAWEAAQNILKAINFDTLLRMPKDDEGSGGNQIAVTASSQAVIDPALTGGGNVNIIETASGAGRAELQANLALLAAQLAEIAQEDDNDAVVHYPVFTNTTGGINTPAVVASDLAAAPAPAMSTQTPLLTVSAQPDPQVIAPVPSSEDPSNVAVQPPRPPSEPPRLAEPQEEEETSDDDMEEVI